MKAQKSSKRKIIKKPIKSQDKYIKKTKSYAALDLDDDDFKRPDKYSKIKNELDNHNTKTFNDSTQTFIRPDKVNHFNDSNDIPKQTNSIIPHLLGLIGISFIIVPLSILYFYEKNQQNITPNNYQDGDVIDYSDFANVFNEPEISLPYNGFIERFHTQPAIAPLQIITSNGGGNYYVKIVSYYSDQEVLTVFIREGQSIEIKVPLGNYIIKYAVGTKWFGTEHHFGPDTVYSQADDILVFQDTGFHITGYTLELYMQRNGNLDTDLINKSEF